MSTIRPLVSLAVAAASVAGLIAAPQAASAAAAAPATMPAAASWQLAMPRLVDVRASHHRGLDRLVFEFRGALPAHRTAQYVNRVIADGSGRRVNVTGDAVLLVRLANAVGHTPYGGTYGPARRSYPLPGIIEVVQAGDFEGAMSFGVGLAKRTPFRLYTLRNPSRVVIDVKTPYRTVQVRDYFLNSRNHRIGRRPYVTPVWRPVIPPSTARGALQRLFAGPTQAEKAAGLRLVTSGATGFSRLTVRDRVAHVRLTGDFNARGSTFTIADEIMPTLKQFPEIRWVKIYDAAGRTENPVGRSDSIPDTLEP